MRSHAYIPWLNNKEHSILTMAWGRKQVSNKRFCKQSTSLSKLVFYGPLTNSKIRCEGYLVNKGSQSEHYTEGKRTDVWKGDEIEENNGTDANFRS